MPRLVILNDGPDTAGCGINLKRAFDRYAPEWETRAICRGLTYLRYPTDIVWPRRAYPTRDIIKLIQGADVLHVMDREGILRVLRPWLGTQKIVVHHLGTHYRRNPQGVSATCRAYGATEVTDSIDLLYPGVSWLPATADLEALAALRTSRYQPHQRVRIAHAPTDRRIKSTEAIERAVKSLAKKRHPVMWDLIERMNNRRCLERKAQADIFVDQLLLGFGLNVIESWAMGIPVVSGLVDADARRKALEMWGKFPWADADAKTLESVIERLVTNPEHRAELGERGRQHVEQWHSYRAVVEQTLAVYERAGMKAAA